MNDLPWLDRLAHDLRGPLGPIQTAAQLLAMPGLDEAQHAELVAMIERQSHALGTMIDQLGDWASLSQGRLVTSREACDTAWLFEHAVQRLRRPVEITRAHDAPGADGLRVEGDARRLVQAFHAMLVWRAGLDADAPVRVMITRDAAVVRFLVGDPVPRDAMSSRALADPAPEGPGLGLGLPIAAGIVAAHGGRLEFEDAGADACRLACQLPLADAPAGD